MWTCSCKTGAGALLGTWRNSLRERHELFAGLAARYIADCHDSTLKKLILACNLCVFP